MDLVRCTHGIYSALFTILMASCSTSKPGAGNAPEANSKYIAEPLVTHIYTADPSAHVFDNRIYIYPSHDTATGAREDDLGSHFAMEDYHVISMDNPNDMAVDNGVALHVKNVAWAKQQILCAIRG